MLPLIAALLIIAACSKGSSAAANAPDAAPASPQGQAQPGSGSTQPPAIKPVPAELPDVLARVNGETISRGDFEKALRNIEGRAGGPVPADQRDRIFRGVLDQLIGYRLLTQEATARKVTVADAVIDERIAAIRGQFPSQEAFNQALEQQQITVEQLRADTRPELTVDKMLQDELASKVAVNPAQVSDFYQKNPDKFQQSERVRASHILIPVPPNADAAAKQQARTQAEAVLKDVKAGKDFAALARQASQDPGSAPNAGDLGFFERGQMVGPFEQAAFSLKPGETSELVETQFGFHIIKVVDKQPSRAVPLDEVRPQIEQVLEGQNRQQQAQAFVETLKAKGKVEIYI